MKNYEEKNYATICWFNYCKCVPLHDPDPGEEV
jgi:hypothetical protein